jgi:PilZ domain
MKPHRPTKNDKRSGSRPALTPHAHGRLRGQDGEEWQVQVSGAEDGVLMLVVLVDSDGLGAGDAATLTLECTSEHGLARFRGEAVLEGSDLVRFRVTDSPEIEQRREFFRVQAPQPVVLAVTGSARIDNAYAVDLSGGGMLLHGPETLRLDDHVRFRLHLEREAAPVKGRARVVRCAADGQRAIVFEEISRQDRERLIHFIFDRQREARARTRGTDSHEQGGENE